MLKDIKKGPGVGGRGDKAPDLTKMNITFDYDGKLI
jgi:hypothetical protein